MDGAERGSLVEGLGERSYRAKQLLEAVYRQRVESIDEISPLSQGLRVGLAEKGGPVGLPQIEQRFVSVDGTVRYLIGFGDGQTVETVWMPEGDGGEAGDGSEAGLEAEGSGSGSSGAEAHSEKDGSIAALKGCATQNPSASQKSTRQSP